ncbi:MAG: flavodoxin [Fusobacteriaceae bacterium]
MEKIGIYYGTTSEKTIYIVEEIEFNLKNNVYEVKNVVDGLGGIEEFKNIILVSPSYGVGELQEDWEDILPELKAVNFKGKNVGIVGLGNQLAFGETYVGAMKIIYDAVIERGANVIGFTSTEGYCYKETEATIDGKFVGLALDEENQADETPLRISIWIKEIKNLFV